MSETGPTPAPSPWRDAVEVARLMAVDPAGLGGVVVRARPGPARDRWLEVLREVMPNGTPVRKLPAHISDDRLLGGLDLAATLRAGRPVAERGVLAEADGGIVVAQMAERMAPGLAARLGMVLDTQSVTAERDGLSIANPARIGVVAIDEGIEDDEGAPPALADRLAFRVALDGISTSAAKDACVADPAVISARERLATIQVPDDILTALANTAEALGVASVRSLVLALRAARASAALAGRTCADESDAVLAGRLVLAPRATRMPAPEQDTLEQDEEAAEPPPPDTDAGPSSDTDDDQSEPPGGPLDERVLEAALAALPPGLLAMAALMSRRRGPEAAGKSGDVKQSATRGRPVGVMRGDPRSGKRLSLIATLRSAAPWQRLRRSQTGDTRRIIVQTDDFRVRRLKHPTETTAIFVVDASGSSALHRLAEAKGAVELLLAECYVRRDRVALLSFRGAETELLLPPTRSLVRAKRSLAGLPGGGGTPLAAAIEAATAVADAVRRKGQTPVIVLLTDGKANVARDGAHGRPKAMTDALAAARVLRAAGFRALLVDTSPKPQDTARRVASEMDATYLPLPHAGSAELSAAVRATLDFTAAQTVRP